MQRGKIELKKGAIEPIRRGLWVAAAQKLEEVAVGIGQMRNGHTSIEYEEGWARVIDCLEQAWSRFYDEGKANFSGFQPWAGAIDAERKKDPLLQYLIQARHQSQHGRLPLAWGEGKIHIAPDFCGYIKDLKIYEDGSFEVEATPTAGVMNKVKLVHEPGEPHLPIIENKKFKQKYNPPAEHLGKPLHEKSPVAVAEKALEYYENIMRVALAKFS